MLVLPAIRVLRRTAAWRERRHRLRAHNHLRPFPVATVSIPRVEGVFEGTEQADAQAGYVTAGGNTATGAVTSITATTPTSPTKKPGFRATNNFTDPITDDYSDGVQGFAASDNAGVFGRNNTLNGVGVWGTAPNGTGVYGASDDGTGVGGQSATSYGVYGKSGSGIGAWGMSTALHGVWGQSWTLHGVVGQALSSGGIGV
ncbi:MAG: hypothetical protein U0821_00780 [Chloroflexota bacterium]